MLMGISLEANYCIQVLTANESERNSIIKKASSRNYAEFNDVRVESRGRYLVFRIGDYKRYKDARKDIIRIQEIASDAYVRKCDFVKEKAVFIANETQEEPFYQEPKQYRAPKNRVRKPKVQNIQKKEYKKREELVPTYSGQENSLWGDCKKCFIPVYEEEEDMYGLNDIQEEPKKIQVKKTIPKQESFWAEDIPVVKTSTPTPKRRNSTKNKFNIDERFLP